jgi:3-isopropylmalate/(R)-2-methylmalate dehydratase small subunit
MEPFVRVDGIAASMRQEIIDTDQIIPAAWQRTLGGDPGKGLFAGWRYDLDGKEIPDFVLNREPFRRARILVGGPNFGCGSSREFAVWALMRFGIRCVIAPSFSDIFFENSFKNGLLPVVLPAADVDSLHQHIERTNDPSFAVDLERCAIELPDGRSIPFTVPEARRTALLEGLDEIGQSLLFAQDIAAFQERDRAARPWVHARPAANKPAGA